MLIRNHEQPAGAKRPRNRMHTVPHLREPLPRSEGMSFRSERRLGEWLSRSLGRVAVTITQSADGGRHMFMHRRAWGDRPDLLRAVACAPAPGIQSWHHGPSSCGQVVTLVLVFSALAPARSRPRRASYLFGAREALRTDSAKRSALPDVPIAKIRVKQANNQLAPEGSCHSKCHSRQVRYSVLGSENYHYLEPPYGIEP